MSQLKMKLIKIFFQVDLNEIGPDGFDFEFVGLDGLDEVNNEYLGRDPENVADTEEEQNVRVS